MKNAFCSATALYGSVALPFVIPGAKPRDLRFRGPLLEMFFERAQRSGPAVYPGVFKPYGSAALPFVIPSGRWACGLAAGSPKRMKNTFCQATALHGSVALPFVIPSAAEGVRRGKAVLFSGR